MHAWFADRDIRDLLHVNETKPKKEVIMNIGIFYGSSSGNTEEAAEKILQKLELSNDHLHDISETDREMFEEYDMVILASSSTGTGNMQPDWAEFRNELETIDFSDKTVAFVGMGDQMMFPDSYLGGISHIYSMVAQKADRVIGGNWPGDGYDFNHSNFFKKGVFRGLALDADNQPELTDERIEKWVRQLENECGC
jgi:flavodoxin I